ncbi:MAG TPA: SurA N-terminal domain-containing protein [Methylomirabilota bacterium]|nr:SurA N-terminal domain-containing protein [Methylomirabilota bacterium]
MDHLKGMHRAAALLPLAAFALALGSGCNKPVQHAPDVWAVVNGKEIKRDEVDKYYRTRVSPDGQEPSQEEALSLKLNVLDELIYNEILLERAKKLNLEATDGEVEDKFTELKTPFTEEEFQRRLKDQGMTVDDIKQDQRRQLSIQKLLNREVVAKISITDQEVTDFYNANKAQFNVAEVTYHLAQIKVTPHKDAQIRNRKNDDATNEAEAQRKVKMLMDRLNSGADFAQLAMDYSEDMNTASTGGDLGFVPESALNSPQVDPALKRAVLVLKAGQVSQPIEARDQDGKSYHILKLIARESPGQRSISDQQIQQTIRDTLRSRKEQLLRSAYLATARDEARVTNYLAQEVLEAAGKLPDAAKTAMPARPTGH